MYDEDVNAEIEDDEPDEDYCDGCGQVVDLDGEGAMCDGGCDRLLCWSCLVELEGEGTLHFMCRDCLANYCQTGTLKHEHRYEPSCFDSRYEVCTRGRCKAARLRPLAAIA